MTFGPDGKLYIVIGDLNRNGQLQNFSAGAEPDDTGVILRLNDDGTVPSDNPFLLWVVGSRSIMRTECVIALVWL
jgi:glucose/arabinose dehydrogenase